MLDVHPPHEAAHTWKDFFIHVATICVGLLIAIGLEQTVEWLHHKAEVRETRRLLKEEREQNVKVFHANVQATRNQNAMLVNDLRIFRYLQQHPGAPRASLPGIPWWGSPGQRYVQAAWTSAKQSNVLALMPQAEVEESRELYERLNENRENEVALRDAMEKASAYELMDIDPTRLTRDQVDTELSLIQDCLRVEFIEMESLDTVSRQHFDFYPGPSEADFLRLNAWDDPVKKFPAADAITKRDFDSFVALDQADQPVIKLIQEISESPTRIAEIYDAFRASHPDFAISEDQINGWGYQRMTADDMPAAIAFFKFNLQRHPNSWNAYDSLGDAYAKAGKKKLAIENYQHALKLNPSAQSSIDALAKLQK